MMNCNNLESTLRRQIIDLISLGAAGIKKLSEIPNLTPSCPYYKYRPLDPLYKAIDSYCEHKSFDIIRYLVEERKLLSGRALSRALECDYIDIAKYLKENDCPFVPRNYIQSIPVMKLVNSWSYKFDENAVHEICAVWNSENVEERVVYLFAELKHPYPIQLKNFDYCIGDDTFCVMIDFASDTIPQLLDVACKWHNFKSVHKLLDKLQAQSSDSRQSSFTRNHLKSIISSTEYKEIENLKLKYLPELDIFDLLPDIFTDISDGEIVTSHISHYSKVFGEKFKSWVIDFDFMSKICKHGLKNSIDMLLKLGISISSDNIRQVFNYECSNLNRGDDTIKKLSYSLSLVNICKDVIDILENVLENEIDFKFDNDSSTADILSRFAALYGEKKFAEHLEVLINLNSHFGKELATNEDVIAYLALHKSVMI